MTAIKVENLSKLYYLGDRLPNSLRDLAAKMFRSRGTAADKDELWALKDLNFEVNEGDTLGIIGRNGAGKSTLLKILSRITKPTNGSATIHGRIGSLLEVGTGFHNELSGRENIYMNGAILGMKRAEINQKFDEIVAFSEIEKFLDTPVKHYSSGMYMRLAFSVAAHLEPEILIVDEVLAVGDAEFQKKCLGKMSEVSRAGRTIIFVSHQLGSIAQLCNRAIMLDKGTLVMDDNTNAVIEHYINHGRSNLASYTADDAAKQREMYVQNATVYNDEGLEQHSFPHDKQICVRVRCNVNKMIRGAELRFAVRDVKGVLIFVSDIDIDSIDGSSKKFEAEFNIPPHILRPGNYSLIFSLFVPHQYTIEQLEDVASFSVFDNGTQYAHSEGIDYGVIFSPCKATIKQIV